MLVPRPCNDVTHPYAASAASTGVVSSGSFIATTSNACARTIAAKPRWLKGGDGGREKAASSSSSPRKGGGPRRRSAAWRPRRRTRGPAPRIPLLAPRIRVAPRHHRACPAGYRETHTHDTPGRAKSHSSRGQGARQWLSDGQKIATTTQHTVQQPIASHGETKEPATARWT